MAIASGEAAQALEDDPGLDDAALAALALAKLQRMHTRPPPPHPAAAAVPAGGTARPLSVVVRRWGREAHARGVYSYVACGASGDDYEALAQPVGRRLFFAGEHCAQKMPSTVAGAYLSGLREAARVERAWQVATSPRSPPGPPPDLRVERAWQHAAGRGATALAREWAEHEEAVLAGDRERPQHEEEEEALAGGAEAAAPAPPPAPKPARASITETPPPKLEPPEPAWDPLAQFI